jgi:hypothetical protein
VAEPSTHPTAHLAQATVATEAAAHYAKQLASHFGHRTEVRTEAQGPRILLTIGSCLLATGDQTLQLRAQSESPEGLEQVQQVIGSPLERFEQREGLTVGWAESS